MLLRLSLLSLFSFCALIFSVDCSLAASESITVRVDPKVRYQTMHGFGASGAWWTNYIMEFDRADREKMFRLLFTKEGADMDIYRYNIPAGTGREIGNKDRRTVNIEISPGEYDYSRDWKARQVLSEIRALGVKKFVLFANSAPARMLKNGKVSGGDKGGSNLKEDSYEDFSNYLLDFCEFLKKEHDLPEITLSPINEPQWKWGKKWRGQEGCHFEPEEAANFLQTLFQIRQQRQLDIPIESPESGSWKTSKPYAEALFSNPIINRELNSFALHSYWTNQQERREFTHWFQEKYPDKELLMTEYCEMAHGHGIGIDPALHMARVIYDDLTVGNVTTWQWWLAIAPGNYNDGLIYADPKSKEITVTKRLWAMANFSRFIKPGATRIKVEAQGIHALGFTSSDNKQVALVLLNFDKEKKAVELQVDDFATSTTTGYLTSEDEELRKISITNPKKLLLPARSISTIVLE